MAKKKQFDWKTHSKPVRLLTAAQEEALTRGVLAPLLAFATENPSSRLEIRARSASLYHRGTPLVRITGDGPFTAEFEPAEGQRPRRVEMSDDAAVAEVLSQLEDARRQLDAADTPTHRRATLHALASANSGADLFADELVVIDTEYNLGQRKLDLVAIKRTEGVTGPGGFANPQLVFGDVRCCGQTLTGATALAAVGGDFAEFAKALGGTHLARAAEELTALASQKVRLGLLPAELEVRSISDAPPHLLCIFAEYDIAEPSHDAPIVELHEKLSARRYPTDLLLFAHYHTVPEPGDDGGAMLVEDLMSYREFKTYRHSLR